MSKSSEHTAHPVIELAVRLHNEALLPSAEAVEAAGSLRSLAATIMDRRGRAPRRYTPHQACMRHPVELLLDTLSEVKPYPEGVVPFSARLPGTAFFPGGAGLWGAQGDRPLPIMPIGGVMILGHDFHSEAAFAKTLVSGGEVHLSRAGPNYRRVPTWEALLDVLDELEIAPARCFFTNVYMGLREGSGTTGRFPGSRDVAFVERCRRFLLKQLDAQRPKLVLTLGAWVPPFLAPLAPQLADWLGVRTLREIDRRGPVRHRVRFDGSVFSCSVVALTHTCLRGPNVGRRRYGDLEGHAAEIAMIREAIVASGVDARVV